MPYNLRPRKGRGTSGEASGAIPFAQSKRPEDPSSLQSGQVDGYKSKLRSVRRTTNKASNEATAAARPSRQPDRAPGIKGKLRSTKPRAPSGASKRGKTATTSRSALPDLTGRDDALARSPGGSRELSAEALLLNKPSTVAKENPKFISSREGAPTQAHKTGQQAVKQASQKSPTAGCEQNPEPPAQGPSSPHGEVQSLHSDSDSASPPRLTRRNLAELQRSIKRLRAGLNASEAQSLESLLSSQDQDTTTVTTEGDAQDISCTDTDPWQALYENWDCYYPLSEEVTELVHLIIAKPQMVKKLEKVVANSTLDRVQRSLRGCNISTTACEKKEEVSTLIDDLAERSPLPTNVTEKDNRRWEGDKLKCQSNLEAVLQRTMLIDTIQRGEFIYSDEPQRLDFSTDNLWVCPRMPSRAVWHPLISHFTKPKPNLAVSFRREHFFNEDQWFNLPPSTVRLICCEGEGDEPSTRVFHFFSIEGKKSGITEHDKIAKCQGLKNAGQALFNMYAFFRDAGGDHLEEFFNKVRFFSAVETPHGMVIRMHWAERFDGEPENLVFPDQPAYNVRYLYKDYVTANGDNFTLEAVSKTMGKILLTYGLGILLPVLQSATEAFYKTMTGRSLKEGNPQSYDIERLGREAEKRKDAAYYYFGNLSDSKDPPDHFGADENASTDLPTAGKKRPRLSAKASLSGPMAQLSTSTPTGTRNQRDPQPVALSSTNGQVRAAITADNEQPSRKIGESVPLETIEEERDEDDEESQPRLKKRRGQLEETTIDAQRNEIKPPVVSRT